MSTGPKQGWGGQRAGAGRPPLNWAAIKLEQISSAIKKAEDEESETMVERLLKDFYMDKTAIRERINIYKVLVTDTMPAEIATETFLSGDDGLPGKRPAPAKVVPISKDED